MISIISIYTGGILTLLMAIFHTRFYSLFKWKDEYNRVSGLNKRIFYTIHIALLLLFFLLGAFTLVYADQLSQSKGLTLGFNLIIAAFWLWRTIWQIFYFKGKAMHYVLIIVFSLLFMSYLVPVFTMIL